MPNTVISQDNVFEVGIPMSFKQFQIIESDSLKGCEYINGLMYIKPECNTFHDIIKNDLSTVLNVYMQINQIDCSAKVEFKNRSEKALGIIQRSFIPDISIICDVISKYEDYSGVPKVIIEIMSESNPNHDKVTKHRLYRAMGVEEYIILDSRKVKLGDVEIYHYHIDNMDENLYVKGSRNIEFLSIKGFILDLNKFYE